MFVSMKTLAEKYVIMDLTRAVLYCLSSFSEKELHLQSEQQGNF
jgi:hypothetical protein